MFGIPAYLFWLIVVVLLVILEASTLSLTCIWFAAGAAAALLTALLSLGFWPQLILFTAVSAICLSAVRPMALRHLNSKKTATNADRVIGKEALVIETIDNSRPAGQVRVDGQVWTARAADVHTVIAAGTAVRILQIQGVKLIVEPIPAATEAR